MRNLKMTLDKFILGQTQFDFFFKPKGEYRVLDCGQMVNGKFESFRKFKFDESSRIISEVGYQSGWMAYPPGIAPPPPVQYIRKYTYENGLLKLVSELDNNTKQKLKTYEFSYTNDLISEIIETSVGQYPSKRNTYEYDTIGNLIKQVICMISIGDGKTYLPSEIIRNEKNQIVRITNFIVGEHKGTLVSKQEISNKEFEYTDNTIKEIFGYPDDNSKSIRTIELIGHNSNLIRTIEYPNGMYKNYVVYKYDANNQNLIGKSTTLKKKTSTEIYKYE